MEDYGGIGGEEYDGSNFHPEDVYFLHSSTSFPFLSPNCSFPFSSIDDGTEEFSNINCSQSSDGVGNEDGTIASSVIVGLILGLVILATIIGNVFVIAAIWMERNLHSSVANYLILSLAVADLMVACLVMPLGAYQEVSSKWLLGSTMCDMWTSSDVLACTASILHLVAIALDRYWAVTSIDYIHHRNPSRIITMIVLIWLIALLVSLSPLFGWKDSEWFERVEQHKCLVSQELSYQLFASLSSFYVPLAVILFLYYRIYETARKRIRRRPPKPGHGLNNHSEDITRVGRHLQPEPTTTTSLINSPSPEKSALLSNGGGGRSTGPTPETTPLRVLTTRSTTGIKNKRESLESKRERKAAKTLAIITGAFIICWLPFFVMALYDAICPPGRCQSQTRPEFVPSLMLWLGYFNSTLNPIIYTIFSPEFRQAFKKILFGRHYRASGSGGGQRSVGGGGGPVAV